MLIKNNNLQTNNNFFNMKSIKRIFVAVALFLGLTIPASAQFSIGPKVGLTVNDMKLDESVFATDNRAGFTAGVTCEFTIPVVNLGFDASVMYVKRTADVMEMTDGVMQEYEIGGDYIEIPINLKWKIGLPVVGKIISPYIFTGPSFAFLTSKKAIKKAWKNQSVDINWNIGLGLQLFSKLQVGAYYGIGINDAVEAVGVVDEPVDIKRQNGWTVTAAWLF